MNETLKNGCVSTGIGLINSHTLPQDKESSKLNEINTSVDNSDVNFYYCFNNSSTGYIINNHNSIYCKNKRNKISTNRYLR